MQKPQDATICQLLRLHRCIDAGLCLIHRKAITGAMAPSGRIDNRQRREITVRAPRTSFAWARAGSNGWRPLSVRVVCVELRRYIVGHVVALWYYATRRATRRVRRSPLFENGRHENHVSDFPPSLVERARPPMAGKRETRRCSLREE